MSKIIKTIPITIKEANKFINDHHRHHIPTANNAGKWAIGAFHSEKNDIVGVAIASNPVSATLMNRYTIEIARLCVREDAPKGSCSFLLSKCCKVWQAMGGKKIITYTLSTESGASLRGAGWKKEGVVKPHKRWLNKTKSDGIKRKKLSNYSFTKYRWENRLD